MRERKWTKIPEEIKDRIVNMTSDDYTTAQIAEELGCSQATVSRVRKERGVAVLHDRGGVVSRLIDISELNKPMREMKTTDEVWIVLNNKTINLIGAKTGFTYTASTKGKDLRIETNYTEPFVIDIKDLANFANELMSVAETVEHIKKNVFEV